MDSHPHDRVLEKIQQLLQFTYDHANEPIATEKLKEIEGQLSELEKQIGEFKKLSDKIIEGSGLTDYLYETIRSDKDSPILTMKDRERLDWGDQLKKEAQNASKDLQKAAKEAGQKKKAKKEKSSKSRKGKFRSFGSSKNWKPL